MRLRLKQQRVDLITGLDMLFGQDRTTRGDPPDQRQAELFPQNVLQLDAARSPRNQIDDAFALQGAQMLFRRIR
jgi:hypothetical protein